MKLSLFPILMIFFPVGHEEPDIFCIGFQEIVKLSPQQVCQFRIFVGLYSGYFGYLKDLCIRLCQLT
jgi:hypothetical protein